MLSEHQLEYGYWPALQMSGPIPRLVRHPREYDTSGVLYLECTQTELTTAQQRQLVDEWCALLPNLHLRTLVFRSKVSQRMFDSAVQIGGLEGLFVKWSAVRSIEQIAGHPSLAALYLGNSPSLVGLRHLSSLPQLRHLFVKGVRESADLSFVDDLHALSEFGLSAGTAPLAVDSLRPLRDAKTCGPVALSHQTAT